MALFHFLAKTPCSREALIILTNVSIICGNMALNKDVGTTSNSHDLHAIDPTIDIISSAAI